MFEEKLFNFSGGFEREKIIITTRYPEHVSSSFVHVISSDKKSNVSSVPSTSEHKHMFVSHVSLLKLKTFYLDL